MQIFVGSRLHFMPLFSALLGAAAGDGGGRGHGHGQNGGNSFAAGNGYGAPSNNGFSANNGYGAPSGNGGIFDNGFQSDDAGFGNSYSAQNVQPAYSNGNQATYGNDQAVYGDNGDSNLAMLEKAVPGTPGEDYPIYAEVPETGFDCEGRVEGGKREREANFCR